MKKIIIFMSCIGLFLSGCKKEITTNANEKIITQTLNFNGESMTYSFKELGKNKYELIPGKDDQKVRDLMKKYPEAICDFDLHDNITFYSDRKSFLEHANPNTANSFKTDADGCKSNAKGMVRYFRDNNYQNQMDLRIVNLTSSFTTYNLISQGFFGNDFSTPNSSSFTAEGFRVPWIGEANNDKMSSLRIEAFTYGPNYPQPNSINYSQWVNYYTKTFYTVLFEHANYGGHALAFHTDDCTPLRLVPALGKYRLLWYFNDWNDDASSMIGFHSNI